MNPDKYRLEPGHKFKLSDFDPEDTGKYEGITGKQKALEECAELLEKISKLQEKLYASRAKALLIVIQAMDGSGKDSTIKNTMVGLNPQGVEVTSFKAPTDLEKSHDYLWRVHAAVPPKGMIGIFNRSHYEEVLITRVHNWIDNKETKRRYQQIRNFEEFLSDNGVVILKFHLHISSNEQKKQLQEWVDDPTKRWKFNPADLDERKLWDDYMEAYQDALEATSTEAAPWYVIPSNNRWFRNLVISRVIFQALEGMDLHYPKPNVEVDWENLKVQ
jgi:PPK2 family polyphosphate:nucleotide phosphotransferase